MTVLDILLAIIAFAIYLAELAAWVATVLPSHPHGARDMAVARAPVPPAGRSRPGTCTWLCRKPLVLEGFMSPKTSEISNGLVRLGADEQGSLIQLRADLDAPSGFASMMDMAEPEGLDPMPTAPAGGYSLDPAYPRAMLTDLDPPWFDKAPIDTNQVPSEYVAPWRYPAHNMAGMRNGWEAPRTHVGPYVQGQKVDVLMNGIPGSDAARHQYEAAHTPAETEAVSAALLDTPGQHLGDPIDYGAYLMGQLTGHWTTANGVATYAANDHAAPLPDFNLDSDRGYAYQCWDYMRHAESKPPPRPQAKPDDLEMLWPDQWGCAPQIVSLLSEISGTPKATLDANVRDWYGYPEPVTVPQRFDSKDNPHHRSRYDPLKRLAHHYLPRAGDPDVPRGWDGSDLQVSKAEMRDAGMSPTGRKPVP